MDKNTKGLLFLCILMDNRTTIFSVHLNDTASIVVYLNGKICSSYFLIFANFILYYLVFKLYSSQNDKDTYVQIMDRTSQFWGNH